MLSRDSFSSLIVQNQSLSDVAKFRGSGKLGAIGAAMEHEGGVSSCLPMAGPQVGDDASRRNLADIVERQFNGYGAQEIVKEHSVGDVTPSRLEEKMNMGNLCAHRNG